MAQPQTHYYRSNYCLILLNFEAKKRKNYFQVDPFIRNASIKLTLQYSLPRQPPVKIELLKIKKNKSWKFFPNSELKVKTYEIFRPYFDRTSSVNDMNVKKMNFKKGFELLKIGSRLQRATTPEEQMFLR